MSALASDGSEPRATLFESVDILSLEGPATTRWGRSPGLQWWPLIIFTLDRGEMCRQVLANSDEGKYKPAEGKRGDNGDEGGVGDGGGEE